MKLFANQEADGDVVQALQAASDRYGAGLAIAVAAEEPAKLSSEARDLMHAGCSGRQRLIRALKGKQRLPLVLLKSNGTRRLGCGARKLLDVLDSPCHHQVNGEAVLPNRAIAELAVLDAANALDRPVILFDAPASFVPVDLLQRLLQIIDLIGGQQHPLHGLFLRRRMDLGDIDGPNPERPERGLALGGTQLHWSKANLKHCMAWRSPLFSGNVHHSLTRHRLSFHILPQTLALVYDAPIALGSNQKLGVGGIPFRQQKQLVDIGFAVSHTDHGAGPAKLALQARGGAKALEPFKTFFLLNGPLVTSDTLAELFRIARPHLDINQAHGRALGGVSHRVVQKKALRSVDPFVDRSQPFHLGMGVIVKASGV